MELVDEVRCEVERIFNVKDRKKALSTMLEQNAGKEKGPTVNNFELSPIFLPLSAENAFVYRAASGIQCDEISKLRKEYIDKIGQEEMGKFKWKKLPLDK